MHTDKQLALMLLPRSSRAYKWPLNQFQYVYMSNGQFCIGILPCRKGCAVSTIVISYDITLIAYIHHASTPPPHITYVARRG